MTREHIEKRIIEIAAEQGDVSPDDVTLQSHFENDLGYDSLTRVEFAMEVEDEFNVSLPDEDIEHVKTVGDAAELVVGAQK